MTEHHKSARTKQIYDYDKSKMFCNIFVKIVERI